MEKYYVPESSEFHVGFEFQGIHPEDDIDGHIWKHIMIVHPMQMSRIEVWIDREEVRVKYLDREDIENCGFLPVIPLNADREYYNVTHWTTEMHNNAWHIHKESNNTYRIEFGFSEYNYDLYFKGEIKNKSELKRILKQVGYERIQNTDD